MLRSARLASGITLQYVERGRASGAPVVLLHGLSDSWCSFEPLMDRLPPTVRAIAITQRGHGGSSKPDDYTFEAMAFDVVGLLETLGIPAAVIVGHSLGAFVAMQLAVDHPERTLGLILMGAMATLEHDAAIEAMLGAVVMPDDEPVDAAFARDFQMSTLARPIPDAWLDGFVGESLRLPARVWRALLRTLLTTPALGDRLRAVRVPVTLLWGDQDVFATAAHQERLRAQMPGARLVTHAGGGHALHWEDPARCAADVVASVFERR
jgi:pimeloyl-ACP methyl ester carboxylesterase